MSPYLTKIGKKYNYLRRVPKDLRFAHPTAIIKFSLHTNSKREADRIADRIDERLERAFADIRLSRLNPTDAIGLISAAIDYAGKAPNEQTLKDIATEYETTKGGDWSAKSKQEYWLSYSLAEKAIGNRLIRLIDRQACLAVRDTIVGNNPDKTLSPRTVNKHLTRLGCWLGHAAKTGIIQSSPFVGVLFEVSKKQINNNYLPYSDDEIKWILEDMLVKPQQKGYLPYKYWLPLIASFTGARLSSLNRKLLASYQNGTSSPSSLPHLTLPIMA